MFNLVVGAVISSILMFFSRFIGIIPDRWNWWFFFTVAIFWGRLMTVCYKNTYSRYMKRALEIFDGKFNEEEKILLTVTAGHIFPPRMYNLFFFQSEPANISSYTCLGSIILLIASIFYEQYLVSCIAFIIFLTGPKLWQPNPFYTGNYQMDIASAVSLFFKEIGENVRTASEFERKSYIVLFISTRDRFYHLWDERNNELMNNIKERGVCNSKAAKE